MDTLLVELSHVRPRQQSSQCRADILREVLIMRFDIANLRVFAAPKPNFRPECAEFLRPTGIAQQSLANLIEKLTSILPTFLVKKFYELADFGSGKSLTVNDHAHFFLPFRSPASL